MIGLRITDGFSTLDFQSGALAVIHFTPHTAARAVRTVAETAEVEVKAPTAGQSTIRSIQQMITSARMRAETGFGRRAFLEFNLGTAGDTYWRSEIIDGWVTLPENDYHYDIASDYLNFTIYLTRLNYWEDLNETSVSMQTATSGTTATIQTVYGHHRAADNRSNQLRLLGSSITGDLPTPCRFQISNNYSTDGPGDITIGHMVENDTDTLEHVIEGETSAIYGTSTKPASATMSNGVSYTLTATGAGEQIAWSAQISQLMLEGMGSNDFNIMARMPSGPSVADLIARASIATDDGLSGLIERWSGKETLVPVSGGWLTLGRMQLPPRYLTSQATLYPLRMRLHTQRLAGGAYSMAVDYIMFMPVYGYRKYRRHSYGIAPGATLHDRPNEGNTQLLYTDGYAEGKLDNFVAEGDPILLVPARNNLLVFAFSTVDTVLRSLSVRAYFRTRRLTV